MKGTGQSGQIPEKFKTYQHELSELRLSDSDFQDLWNDYCEVLLNLQPIEELHRLRLDLECEILEALRKA